MTHNFDDLKIRSKHARISTLNQIFSAGSGHPGGSLSAVDILVFIYSILQDSDFFVLSKGHAAPALYAILAEYDRIPKDELSTFRQINSRLQGHPHSILPTVVTPTGSLGQGASVSVGLAMGDRSAKVYCLLGDGELQEGIIWEAAMFAAHYGLSNLVWVIDYNRYQSDAELSRTMDISSICEKFDAFNWLVNEVNGHSFDGLDKAFRIDPKGRPHLILAHTVKGRGVLYMEDNPSLWHGSIKLSQQ